MSGGRKQGTSTRTGPGPQRGSAENPGVCEEGVSGGRGVVWAREAGPYSLVFPRARIVLEGIYGETGHFVGATRAFKVPWAAARRRSLQVKIGESKVSRNVSNVANKLFHYSIFMPCAHHRPRPQFLQSVRAGGVGK